MKKSTKRIIVFESIFCIILILNSFIHNFLKGYTTAIFLLIALVIFKILCGLEKDRHRYIKDIIYEIIIFLLIFFLLYYLFGIIIGFSKTASYFDFQSIKNIIIPLILKIIATEILRYQILTKSETNKKLIILTCILFIFLDVSNSIYYGNFATPRTTFLFLALTLLPSISRNIVACYISLKFGYKPILFYLLVMGLYLYLLPLVPNPTEFLTSLIQLLLPVLLLIRIIRFVNEMKDKEVERDYKKHNISAYIIPTILVIISVYFTSGYFRFYAIAVASGSMSPNIEKGDIAIIDQHNHKPKVGEVIAFKHDKIIVVHRLINTVKVGDEIFYYTKGDANKEPDGYPIEQKQIVGVVNVKIPLIGKPTVWINEL